MKTIQIEASGNPAEVVGAVDVPNPMPSQALFSVKSNWATACTISPLALE
jgi:hypothetical protein